MRYLDIWPDIVSRVSWRLFSACFGHLNLHAKRSRLIPSLMSKCLIISFHEYKHMALPPWRSVTSSRPHAVKCDNFLDFGRQLFFHSKV